MVVFGLATADGLPWQRSPKLLYITCVCCFNVHIHTMPLNSNMPSASKAFGKLVEE